MLHLHRACVLRTAVAAVALAAFLTPGSPWAQAPAAARAAGAAARPAPLIDRELFFGNPEITSAQISPDGQYVAFLKPYKETRNVWVKKTAEPFTAARLVTADTKRPIPGYFWSRDSKYILFVQDNGRRRELQRLRGEPGGCAGRRPGCAAGAQPHRRQGRARDHLRVPRKRARHDLRRAERPRCRLARPVQGDDLHRHARAPAQEHGQDRAAGRSTTSARCGSRRRTAENGDTEILDVRPEG